MRKLLAAIIFCIFTSGTACSLPWRGHIAVQNQYVWGLTTETGRIIHSEIIDKVPWRINGGGWAHRPLWGHTDEWFYMGRIPKTEAMRDIEANLRRQHPAWPAKRIALETEKVYKEAVSISGQERIASELMKKTPALTKKEAMALAEQEHFVHNLGDSTTREKLTGVDTERGKRLLRYPPKEAVSGFNKSAVAEAMENQGDKFSAAEFARQPRSFERLRVMFYEGKGFDAYSLPSREDIGITVRGQNYIIKKDWSGAVKTLKRFPNERVLLPDDVYAKGIGRHSDLAGKVIRESQATGVMTPLAEQETQTSRMVTDLQREIGRAEIKRTAAIEQQMRRNRSALRKIDPYALGGAMMSLSENWGLLEDAWAGKSTWLKALARTGADFAGYTVTPYLADGILKQIGDKFVIAAPLRAAGLGYTLGFFIWNAGKEYLSYQMGNISHEDFIERIKKSGAQTGREAAMIPVNILVYKLISATGAGTFFVPIVIIGGAFAVQRTQQWYEDRQWRKTIYLEDLKNIIGEDLINEFTFITAETRPNFAESEQRPSLSEPEERPNLINPRTYPNIINY